MATLNPSNGSRTYSKAEVTQWRSEDHTTVYTNIKVYFARDNNGYTTSGHTNIKIYIDNVLVSDTTPYVSVSGDWVLYADYTHTDVTYGQVAHSVKYVTTSSVTSDLAFSSDATAMITPEYWSGAGGATINRIEDLGNNTLKITTTMGADGINNAVSNVHIYGYVNTTSGTPTWGNSHFEGRNGQVSGRTVTFIIPAPSTDASYMVRVSAWSISAKEDNPLGDIVNSGTCYYHSLSVNYYSNYATEAYAGTLNSVGADKNVLVGQWVVTPQSGFPDNLHNYVEVGSTMYLGRKGYTGTGYWGTELNGGILIAQNENFASYEQMASRLGVSSIGKVSINLYPQWKSNSNIRVKVDDDWKNGKVWINVNGSWKKSISVFAKVNGVFKRNL